LITADYFQRIDQYSNITAVEPLKMKNVVILGGSYAGVSTAHRILKQATKSATAAAPFKITLVSPNSHFYWSMASPRGILPGQLSDEQIFQPIATGFKQYPASRFEFVLAHATALDFDGKAVTISDGSSGQAVARVLDYDYLILATGSHTRIKTPFKGLGSTEATKTALHDFQARIEKAKTIVVAGGGVTGVEAAGELAFQYGPQKEIILVSEVKVFEEHPFVFSIIEEIRAIHPSPTQAPRLSVASEATYFHFTRNISPQALPTDTLSTRSPNRSQAAPTSSKKAR
jgi:NADH dehydrogenase FAD-containing subunit